MSAALAAHPDTSTGTNSTHPEISLGSIPSGFSTPGRHLRIPSVSSRSTAPSSEVLATPSTPTSITLSRDDADENGGGDLLDTPALTNKRYGEEAETPRKRGVRATAPGAKGGVTLTLRDQEKHIDNLKKENFNIKLRVHFLEERLAQLAPDQIDAALKQNINLKIEVQQRNMELKKLKKLLAQYERDLETQRTSSSSNHDRERELEEKLEEREREIRELRRLKAGRGDDHGVVRELEMRNSELEGEVEGVRELLQDNMEEIERLRDLLEHRDDDLGESSQPETSRTHSVRRISDLEEEISELHHQLEVQAEAIAQRDDDKDELIDVIETLKLELEDLHRRREAESVERSESRAMIMEEREEREAVEDDLNAMKDRLAALLIEIQQKEDEIDQKNREIDELVAEHKRIVEVVEDEWRGEVEEARGQADELKDVNSIFYIWVLAEREADVRDLRINVSEFESRNHDLQLEFEAALNDLEVQAEAKDAQIEAMRTTIDKLGEDIYNLEDENDKIKDEAERLRDDDSAERERLAALSAALKEEDLTRQISDLSDELEHITKSHQRVIDDLTRKHEDELRKSARTLESKESTLQSTLNDLNRLQALLSQREEDLHDVQDALEGLEEERKRRGEVDTTARFSLQLELDRLKRDLERVEDELSRARKEIDDKEIKVRDKDSVIDKLSSENRDLAAQVAAHTQTKLNLTEKLDLVQGNLRKAESELEGYRSRMGDLEMRLSKDQRSLLNAENQYRDQLTERNTLLLTIYQYMDKILGVDKVAKKGNAGETKPFTNFSVFHDNLITRLKALSQIQLDFDKRCKEVESKYVDKLNEIKKQLETRWKQIDKFEAGVKSYGEAKATWRRKLSAKEGEVDALKTSNTELQQQISSLRRLGHTSDSSEVRSLQARATNAERRLNNAQNQLLATEEKIASINQKNAMADNKWDARVKEYEARLKAAEERVKRERQGSKERVAELENNIKNLQSHLDKAHKRDRKLEDVIETNKVTTS
ncbi:hypothetical protein AGABI1DRAFT_120188 [Agaricus bisporus var. burnettii JB137-S8]|uniref:Centrosomin N-terminal motif 1 domain-containing protein n=1 Tax=Agaricus bisporus var. burnettii (strain JB137-S8 / ATCC MYA-4627 / FGSC 10392) TaxID=597362 RepID=K5WXF5_AGABU|nr:uncharacterized protein AGABI1DRAFT_120188 [Agaricus bisporus var. burnettii JB137-S8]EKM80156.1 hypothetical protein AGABI1DRAFT_120188 [Agaricus bisporus var. burnettii JB137-S8]